MYPPNLWLVSETKFLRQERQQQRKRHLACYVFRFESKHWVDMMLMIWVIKSFVAATFLCSQQHGISTNVFFKLPGGPTNTARINTTTLKLKLFSSHGKVFKCPLATISFSNFMLLWVSSGTAKWAVKLRYFYNRDVKITGFKVVQKMEWCLNNLFVT